MDEAVGSGRLMVRVGAIGKRMVEVEDLLNGSWAEGISTKAVGELMQAGLPTCRSRSECCGEAMVVGALQECTVCVPIIPLFSK